MWPREESANVPYFRVPMELGARARWDVVRTLHSTNRRCAEGPEFQKHAFAMPREKQDRRRGYRREKTPGHARTQGIFTGDCVSPAFRPAE
jgi:hypothetical protein